MAHLLRQARRGKATKAAERLGRLPYSPLSSLPMKAPKPRPLDRPRKERAQTLARPGFTGLRNARSVTAIGGFCQRAGRSPARNQWSHGGLATGALSVVLDSCTHGGSRSSGEQ
jgi:hypothetical protein